MNILNILNECYPMCFHKIEHLRDGGSSSYLACADEDRYFLRVVSPAFFDTAITGVEVQVFLQEQGFPVPTVVFTKNNKSHVVKDEGLFILYEFIEGEDAEPERDADVVGALVGRLHQTMKSYGGKLVRRDKRFYVDRYIDILRKKQYPRAEEFATYGNALWERVKHLPRGYCHGDMYSGNVMKTGDGKLYLLDHDTSCDGFRLYDIVLFCNRTDYFEFKERGYEDSKRVLERFLPEYEKHNALNDGEADAFCDFIALYHFALQATIIEIYGSDCVDDEFLDAQLDWLYRWEAL